MNRLAIFAMACVTVANAIADDKYQLRNNTRVRQFKYVMIKICNTMVRDHSMYKRYRPIVLPSETLHTILCMAYQVLPPNTQESTEVLDLLLEHNENDQSSPT